MVKKLLSILLCLALCLSLLPAGFAEDIRIVDPAEEIPDAASSLTAEITEVTNYSHYYQTGQYYEGAFVVWKEHVLINGTPIQTYDDSTGEYVVAYSEDWLTANGIDVGWYEAGTGEPALIDYDSQNVNYYGGPARVGSYYAVVTQTLAGVTEEISERVCFDVTPTEFCLVTDTDDITTGARWYLYSILGEMDGQLYAMAMPETEGTLRAEAIPVYPDENGVVTLGYARENVFCMRRDPGYHRWGDATHPERDLLQLVSGTAWDLYFGGGNGSIWRGGGWTGDDGFYVSVDPDSYALEAIEPHMGHGTYLLVKDGDGKVFFTRAMWGTGHANSELGVVTECATYLYWNQIPTGPVGNHSYEFLGTPYDKEYDGEPIAFDPNKNIQVDGGKTAWADLEAEGTARLVWREWQGKETVDLEESPSAIGVYEIAIQEPDGKDWFDVLTEGFSITEPAYDSVAEALAGENGAEFTVKGVVTMIDGKNVYVQDETGGICLYFNTAPTDLALGDTVIGGGTRAVYRGLPELSGATYERSEGLTLEAWETTIGALTTADICTYVSLTGLEVTEVFDNNGQYSRPNITVKDAEENTIQIYKAVVGKTDGVWNVQVGDTVDFKGAVGVNNATLQLRNTLAEEITVRGAQPQELTVEDHTGGQAEVSVEAVLPGGEIVFTAASEGDQAVLVLLMTANGYTVLPCTTDENGVHRFTAQIPEGASLVLIYKGDADGNGKVNMRDSLAIKKHTAGTEGLSDILLLAANADGSTDGKVNMRDSLTVKKSVAGTESIGW